MTRKPAPTFVCAHCGQIAECRLCRTRDGKHSSYNRTQRFCSRECGYAGRKWRPISAVGYLVPSGYRRLHKRGGAKVYQHREIVATLIGRPLLPEETVHHKDGDRDNNAPENLELWSSRQPPGQRVEDKIAWAIELLETYPHYTQARVRNVQIRNANEAANEVILGALSIAA